MNIKEIKLAAAMAARFIALSKEIKEIKIIQRSDPAYMTCSCPAFARAIEQAVIARLAGVSVEPVGSVYVSHFRDSKAMQNRDFDYWGDLPDGSHQLVTLGQLQTAIAAARVAALEEAAKVCEKFPESSLVVYCKDSIRALIGKESK